MLIGATAWSSKARRVRPPALRVRQAVKDNSVPLLLRLQHKADLRNVDRNRLTSLSWAAIEGSLEVFEWLLLDYGHDDQELSRDSDNNTILHLLASIPSPPALSPHVHLLHSSFDSDPRSSNKPLAEQIAICLRMTRLYHTLFPFLLDWSNSGGKTALHVAAQAGNTAFVNLLLDFGADSDPTDLQGNTPLHYASAWGHLGTMTALLEKGCQPATRNSDGFTASDFAYNNNVMGSLHGLARKLLDERSNRQHMEGYELRSAGGTMMGHSPYPADGRFRSRSVSTNRSTGSGSALSSNPAPSSSSTGYNRSQHDRPRHIATPEVYGTPASHRSEPSSRRGSEPSDTRDVQRPPLPPMPPTAATSAGRPIGVRSPSLPSTSNRPLFDPKPPYGVAGQAPPMLAAPLPTTAMMSGIGMRRVNSAQADSGVGVGASSQIRKPGSGPGGRGTPI